MKIWQPCSSLSLNPRNKQMLFVIHMLRQRLTSLPHPDDNHVLHVTWLEVVFKHSQHKTFYVEEGACWKSGLRFSTRRCCHFEGSNAKARAVIPILRKFTVARLLEPHCKLWTWADLGGLGRTWAEADWHSVTWFRFAGAYCGWSGIESTSHNPDWQISSFFQNKCILV